MHISGKCQILDSIKKSWKALLNTFRQESVLKFVVICQAEYWELQLRDPFIIYFLLSVSRSISILLTEIDKFHYFHTILTEKWIFWIRSHTAIQYTRNFGDTELIDVFTRCYTTSFDTSMIRLCVLNLSIISNANVVTAFYTLPNISAPRTYWEDQQQNAT